MHSGQLLVGDANYRDLRELGEAGGMARLEGRCRTWAGDQASSSMEMAFGHYCIEQERVSVQEDRDQKLRSMQT